MNARLPSTLTFEGTDLTIIDRDGKPWIAAADLARALGYSETRKVTRLYSRHPDEFSKDMTQVIDASLAPKMGIRIFSPRGCHLIAMLSRTNRAKTFRKWVLDVLESLANQPPKPLPKLPPQTEPDLGSKTRQEIDRRAQELSVEAFQRARDALEDLARQWKQLQPHISDGGLAEFIQARDLRRENYLVVRSLAFYGMTEKMARLGPLVKEIQEAIHELEEETGVKCYSH
ncbi:BRO-N domain-containing protein [Methylohalobius crimeensis]|uniref:BRO-N domain-containing protein n=1 Tax=Methylohalobius crimeensis TaxID=244365 RepID=UPI0003B72B28|nr:BRO family protein [Methylohalobius crimeensis]